MRFNARFIGERAFPQLEGRTAENQIPRTIWAERHVEGFIAPVFVAEFVFRSPQVVDPSQKEVVDFLIARGSQNFLVSQKCQEDPTARSGEKLERWARKKAHEAADQLKGALNRVGVPNPIWCDHERRGRVEYADGLPNITHTVATIEVFERVQLDSDLQHVLKGVPVSYLSVNDFVNLCMELRTVPEVARYLEERCTLPDSVRSIIGSEQMLFSYYLLHDGSFNGLASYGEGQHVLDARSDELAGVLHAHLEQKEYAQLLEHVADQLAGRHANFAEGLSPEVMALFEPTHARKMYLTMQDLLAGLMLPERAALGRVFDDAIKQRKERGGRGLCQAAALVPSHPDCVFVLGSVGTSETFTRNELLKAFDPLARAAMANYGRNRALLVFDRDGKSYEVGYGLLNSDPRQEEIQAGRNVFGKLRVFESKLTLRPFYAHTNPI